LEERAQILIAGGGLGGVAAAIAACEAGAEVVLVEGTDWLGGQLTTQAVPPDEHPWIEQFGCTARYRRLRDAIRAHYRRWYPLTPAMRASRELNPGGGLVSKLCHEPRVAVAVIESMLTPHRGAGRLTVLMEHEPVHVELDGDRTAAVTLEDHRSGGRRTIRAGFVLDATETGDLLPLSGTEHVTGSEARAETGEPHAPERADPSNMQAVTHCFVLDHRAGEDHTIERPAAYAHWREHVPEPWPGPLLSFTAPEPKTGQPRRHTFSPNPDDDPADAAVDMRAEGGADDLWLFRRIAARRAFARGAYPSDLTLVNWPMADYFAGPVIGVENGRADEHRRAATELSRSLLHWLQTEAPRPDGGAGWPGLRLRPDVTGTSDGLAKALYIREPRRIRAQYTVVEQDVAADLRPEAVRYHDSVGIGAYRIDLHPSTGGDGYIDIAAHPFRIPLGALLPVRVRNLLAAGKSIGTTHITNGCYRLHPVEWNIGEAAGRLAAFCLAEDLLPEQVRAETDLLDRFQQMLAADGVELSWPEVGAY
jgi:hypothetical protein